MEKENPTLIKDNRYESHFDGYEDDWNADPAKEISNQAAEQWLEDEQIDNAVPLDLEAEKELPEKAETESDSEGNLEKKLNKGTESSSVNSVPAEILQQFGDGPWNKTYTEQGVATFDFQTGEMMSADGSISLTQQIRDNASGEHAALHEQVIAGWQASSGGAQLISFNEKTEGGTVVHVTKTWVESDGQISSETWSKELPQEKQPIDLPDQDDWETSGDTANDDSLSNQDLSLDHNLRNLPAEATAENQTVRPAEVLTRQTQSRASDLELPATRDRAGASPDTVKASVPEQDSSAPDQSLSLDESSPSLEPVADSTPAFETASDDQITPHLQNSRPEKAARATETTFSNSASETSIPSPQSPVTEPRPRSLEQSDNEALRVYTRGISGNFGGAESAEAEGKTHSSAGSRPWSSAKADKDLTAAEESPAPTPEKSSPEEDSSVLDNDFETIPAAENKIVQPEKENLTSDTEQPVNAAPIETGESDTGIEIIETTDHVSAQPKFTEPIVTIQTLASTAPENHQCHTELPEDTGITLVTDITIDRASPETKSAPAENQAWSADRRAENLATPNEAPVPISDETFNPATVESDRGLSDAEIENPSQIASAADELQLASQQSLDIKQPTPAEKESPSPTLAEPSRSTEQLSQTASAADERQLANQQSLDIKQPTPAEKESPSPTLAEPSRSTEQLSQADETPSAQNAEYLTLENQPALESIALDESPLDSNVTAEKSAAAKTVEPLAPARPSISGLNRRVESKPDRAERTVAETYPAREEKQDFDIEMVKPIAKPITITLTKKTVLPFRSAELINRLLTYQPTAITDDDTVTNENQPRFFPEFKLAAR